MALTRFPEGTFMQVRDRKALAKRRDALNYSLRDVAELLGRPNGFGFIARLERGEAKTCTPEFARSLAAVLQRDVTELFTPREPKTDVQDARKTAA